MKRPSDNVRAERFLAGQRLKSLREAKGVSLRELADRIGGGVHFTTIGKLESGKTKLTPEWIDRIAPALEVSPLEIVDEAFSQYSVKAVPLFDIRTFEDTDAPNANQRIGYAPSTVGYGDCFAIGMVLDLDGNEQLSPGFFIVDPFLKGALDRRIQLLRLLDGQLFAGRFDAKKAEYKRWMELGPVETVAVGAERFHAIGTVVFVGYYP